MVKVDDQLEVSGKQPDQHSDGWIAFKVKAALLFHSNVSATDTSVSVKDGVVTLQGEAKNDAQKELTGEYAKDVEGVRSVENQMTVSKATTSPESTTHEEIERRLDHCRGQAGPLLWHHSTSAVRTKVSTKNGVVTIGGQAKNDAEKSLVTKLAGDTKGGEQRGQQYDRPELAELTTDLWPRRQMRCRQCKACSHAAASDSGQEASSARGPGGEPALVRWHRSPCGGAGWPSLGEEAVRADARLDNCAFPVPTVLWKDQTARLRRTCRSRPGLTSPASGSWPSASHCSSLGHGPGQARSPDPALAIEEDAARRAVITWIALRATDGSHDPMMHG